MKPITKTFYAVQSGDYWTVFGRSEHGYTFTVDGDCDGFVTFRDARHFTLLWVSASKDAGVCPASKLGRQIAHSIKVSYNDWLSEATQAKQTA
jgi:hypothetical protein